MTGFLTPREMFQEYMDREARDRFNLEKIMMEYAAKAERKIGEYADCIAESYLCGYERGIRIFKELELGPLHAYAVLDDEEKFEEEIEEEKIKLKQTYWDDYED